MRRLLTVFFVLLALGLALAALGLLVARRGGAARLVGAERVLTLELAGGLDDYRAAAPLPWLDAREPADLAALWRALGAARADATVRALAVRIGDLGFGLAKAQEIRRQLAAVAAAGKPVACYLDTAGEGSNGTLEYYLAAACSSISLAPAGELNLLGLWADPLFFRGSLEKLRIEPSFLTAGRYKSAAEAFTEHGHSPAAREALDAVLDGYFRQLVGGIAAARGLSAAEVSALVDAAPLSAARALEARLVDRLEYADELRARLDEELGGDLEWLPLSSAARPPAAGGDEIAVVFAAGPIVRGAGGFDPWTRDSAIGARGLGSALDELADDRGVRAVVLRVDSPGGSAVASDLLHHQVRALARRKPVVVSMSDLAASGGYYLAAGASRIVAEPATLTGSIGVVMGKLATARFEEELLGVTRDPLARGAQAGLYSGARPFDDAGRRRLEVRIGEVYDRFLGVVAEGRDLPRATVERVAQGRIWTGEDALAHRLIDELGGLDAAVGAARELAGIAAGEERVRFYPRAQGIWEWLAARRPPAFSGELARFAASLREATRTPGLLELPAGWRALTRPF